MSGSLTLKQNFVWTLLGNGVYAVCQWGILVVLAKLGTPAMVGRFALGLAIGAPVFMLANLQLRAIQATDARREYEFRDYYGLRLITVAAALLVVAAIALLFGYTTEVALVVVAVGLAKGFESVSDIQYGLFQQQERMDRIAVSMIARGLIGLCALAIVLRVTGDLLLGLISLAFVWATVAFGFDLARVRKTVRDTATGSATARPRFLRSTLSRLALLALPMGLVMMLLSLTTNIPRYFVEWHHGEADLGIFSAIAAILVAGNMVITALGQSASPRLARYHADGEKQLFIGLLVRLLGIGLVIGAAAVAAAALVGREILAVLYDAQYAKRIDVFIVLMFAGTAQFLGSFLGTAVTAMRLFKPQVVAHLITVVCTVVAAMILIGSRGLAGAAWTVLAGTSVSLVCYAATAIWGITRIEHCLDGEGGSV